MREWREELHHVALRIRARLNEYELDLLRQRSLSARYEEARRGELIVSAPVGFVKARDRYEKDPDRRVQEAIRLAAETNRDHARGTRAEPAGRCRAPLKESPDR
jgi:DNA invertase Pin-like site-specific DNA recombinase